MFMQNSEDMGVLRKLQEQGRGRYVTSIKEAVDLVRSGGQ